MTSRKAVLHLQTPSQRDQEISNRREREQEIKSTTVNPVIRITKGIFQDDTLSPIWFCLVINPLSNLLSRTRIEYNLHTGRSNHTVSHQLYMNDLKLYTPSYEKLNDLIMLVEEFSNDIKMEFDKCKVINMKRGKYGTIGV